MPTPPVSPTLVRRNPVSEFSISSNEQPMDVASVNNVPLALPSGLLQPSSESINRGSESMQSFRTGFYAAVPSQTVPLVSKNADISGQRAERDINPATPTQPKMDVPDIAPGSRIHPDLYADYQQAWEGYKARVFKRAPLFTPPVPSPLFSVVTQKPPIHSAATPMRVYEGIFDGYNWNDPINFVADTDMKENYSVKQSVQVLAGVTGTPVDVLLKKAGIPADTDVRMTGREFVAFCAVVCGYHGHTLGMVRDTWWDTFGVKKYFADAVREHPEMVAKLIFGRVREVSNGDAKAESGKVSNAMTWSKDGLMHYRLFDYPEVKDEEGVRTVKAQVTSSLSHLPEEAIYWVLETDEREMSPQYWKEKDIDRAASGLPPYVHSTQFRPLMLAVHSWGAAFSERFNDDASGASDFSKWLDDFRLYAGVRRGYDSKIRLDMVKLLNYMAGEPALQAAIYKIVSQAPTTIPERYSSVLVAMDGAYRDSKEEVFGRQMQFAMSADNTNPYLNYTKRLYNKDTGYALVLGGLLKKSDELIAATIGPKGLKLPSGEMQTLKDVENLYAAANYSGKMIPFASHHEVKKYLIKALQKVPKLILKLPLGYLPTQGGAKVVCVKAWWSTENGGFVCYDSEGKKICLYQEKEGTNSYKDATGKMIYVQLKGQNVCHSSEDARSQEIYKGVITPSMAYRLLDFDAEGQLSVHIYPGLSKLPPCNEFWLYETGKRYSVSSTLKNK
ncbi:hypothetical protein ACVBEF_03435 [Glaciimonas sp. GG7]